MKKVVSTVLFALCILAMVPSSVNADMWSKMFKVKKVQNNPQDLYEYGQQVGYNDALNGERNYRPTNEPFVRGYYNGQRQAIYDSQQRYYDEHPDQMPQQPVIIIYPDNRGYIVNQNGYQDNTIYYDH